MYTNLSQFSSLLQYISNMLFVPLCLCKEHSLLSLSLPFETDKKNSPYITDEELAQNLSSITTNYQTIQEPENPHIFYMVEKLDESYSIIIGPACSQQLNAKELYRYQNKHYMSHNQSYVINICVPFQMKNALNLINHLCSTDNTQSIEMNMISSTQEESFFDLGDSLQTYLIDKLENEPQHYPQNYLFPLHSSIARGDYEAFKDALNQIRTFSVGKMAHNVLKQKEYESVVLITSLFQTATDAGMNPYFSNNMSDIYLQKIALCKTIEDYENLWYNAAKQICNHLKEIKGYKTQSILVEKCKRYVSEHLTQSISISDISTYIGVSKSYLSTTFSKSEQITLKQYIIKEKLNAAQNMLKYSDYSISAIAAYLHLGSQSHFSEIFKKETGMTPSQYKNVYHTF